MYINVNIYEKKKGLFEQWDVREPFIHFVFILVSGVSSTPCHIEILDSKPTGPFPLSTDSYLSLLRSLFDTMLWRSRGRELSCVGCIVERLLFLG